MSDSDRDCVFCRILAGELPSTQVYADEAVVAIEDARPQAPVHVLVLPRRHIAGVAALGPGDDTLLGRLIGAANQIARDRQIAATGYRLVINQGHAASQTVGHLHLHVLGGRRLG
jgi:histidine triad (HIT) family protein